MNDFCPQKTLMSPIWMSSCFYFDQKPYFSKANNWKKKNLFSRNKSRAHATFFYHFFSETNWSMIHSCFVCKYDNFVCAGNWLIFSVWISIVIMSFEEKCMFLIDFNWIIQNEYNMKFGLHVSLIFQLWICFKHKRSINQK